MSEKVMSTVSYAGAAAGVTSALTLNEWGVIIGIATALVTLIANMIYHYRKDRREQLLHDLEVERLRQRDHGPGNECP